ncbi:cysteine desulfurase [Candidatus Uhrbacteria bacterium CG_4_10_14_0_8_um_filter_58_22]|uniref:Cysteine desulfurase n=1 Tax=Candidatus Uhrbacteria bacterium CG_4_10_14_0_8_um_filter_58_22 TaxID=1975029 RepID=A0A2M7QBH5_9BACT|nr:MAG: cysteine desulfurase [Candidatus Uhrbacteria bacterium CG_4_10_14_0_8_um_filter_58_22]
MNEQEYNIAGLSRQEFPMLQDAACRDRNGRPFHYLDSAASALTPESVLRAMDGYYRQYRCNVHRGMYDESARATEEYETSRIKVAGLLNAAPEEIVFTRGATESLNMVAYKLAARLGPGDEVVISIMEHHANLVTWQQFAKQYGFKVRFIGLRDDFTLDMDEARRLIGPQTKVVSVMHVSNALGTVLPLGELHDLARQHGATVIVDAAQSVGHRPIDVQTMDCDFLAFSGHKMYGPTGIGVLYGKHERLDALDPFLYGGDMILEVTEEDSKWNGPPHKFEAGTPNIAGAIGLGAAVDFVTAVGVENIERHERALARRALSRLADVPGLKIYGPTNDELDRGGVVSFNVEGIHPHDMTDILGGEGVCTRGGHHCAMPLMRRLGLPGTTRASFGLYNGEKDIEALQSAILKAIKTLKA